MYNIYDLIESYDNIKLDIYEAYDNGEISYDEKEYLLEESAVEFLEKTTLNEKFQFVGNKVKDLASGIANNIKQSNAEAKANKGRKTELKNMTNATNTIRQNRINDAVDKIKVSFAKFSMLVANLGLRDDGTTNSWDDFKTKCANEGYDVSDYDASDYNKLIEGKYADANKDVRNKVSNAIDKQVAKNNAVDKRTVKALLNACKTIYNTNYNESDLTVNNVADEYGLTTKSGEYKMMTADLIPQAIKEFKKIYKKQIAENATIKVNNDIDNSFVAAVLNAVRSKFTDTKRKLDSFKTGSRSLKNID